MAACVRPCRVSLGWSGCKREDGRGWEIKGIGPGIIEKYSKRTHGVTKESRKLAHQWFDKYGREPNAREMLFINDKAQRITKAGKSEKEVTGTSWPRSGTPPSGASWPGWLILARTTAGPGGPGDPPDGQGADHCGCADTGAVGALDLDP